MDQNIFLLLLSMCLMHKLYFVSSSTITKKSDLDMNADTESADLNTVVRIILGIVENAYNIPKVTRVKRQSGTSETEGRFEDSAKAPQIKVVRQFLQMFKNFVSVAPIGGRHPLSTDTPYGAIYLFKTVFLDYFFPEVGRNYANRE